ncbi:unnamed protein product [Protopolystoma xenopodis]|uniref:Uncharacterized protein n=1 Tax=Protopolystoma xenopodis TaxID=117903 RepID=A0A448XG01_9PLAT|nr:unnamed protein product [Protopolystoma xenopodis]
MNLGADMRVDDHRDWSCGDTASEESIETSLSSGRLACRLLAEPAVQAAVSGPNVPAHTLAPPIAIISQIRAPCLPLSLAHSLFHSAFASSPTHSLSGRRFLLLSLSRHGSETYSFRPAIAYTQVNRKVSLASEHPKNAHHHRSPPTYRLTNQGDTRRQQKVAPASETRCGKTKDEEQQSLHPSRSLSRLESAFYRASNYKEDAIWQG